MKRLPIILLSAASLAACSVGPDYQKPALDLPEHWHALFDATPTPADATEKKEASAWWLMLHDETLNGLISRALANNQDLQIAKARIYEARGAKRSAAGALYPNITAQGQASRGDQGVQTFDQTVNLFDAEFDASYEIDLFGGNRRQLEAQNALLEANKAHAEDVTATLTAEVARQYVQWRQLQELLRITQEAVAAQQKLSAITQAQYNAGTVSTFDVSQSQTLYKNTLARTPDIERQLETTGYALSVLLGETPGKLNDELQQPAPLPVPDAVATLDSPADIIARRPDVREAERQLAAATALHGAAISDLYPKITLSTLFGIQNSNLAIEGLTPTSTVWSIGAGIMQPVLDFGRIEGQIDMADARQQEAFHTYQKTVLQALADVETSLANLGKENDRRLTLQDAQMSAQHAVDMSNIRYKEGISDFTDVLQSQQQLYAIQTDLAASQAQALEYLIALNKAIGATASAQKQN